MLQKFRWEGSNIVNASYTKKFALVSELQPSLK